MQQEQKNYGGSFANVLPFHHGSYDERGQSSKESMGRDKQDLAQGVVQITAAVETAWVKKESM